MYNHNSNFHQLNTQQHVSLDKHRQMINNAARWQSHSEIKDTEPKTTPIAQLRPVFATILNIFTR